MRYIRFLKTPRIVDEHASKAHVYCLITITSDLGDSFLPYDVVLSAELLTTTPSEEVIVWRTVQWTNGMRTLPITLPLSKSQSAWPLRVRVGIEPKATFDQYSKLSNEDYRGIVSAWSAALDPPKGLKEAERLVERRFGSAKNLETSIWEETGESIARHLWDAGVTTSCRTEDLLSTSNKHAILSEVLSPQRRGRRIRVVELGTGCGIVGITIAQKIENVSVLLTDLPEAEEIVQRNLRRALLAKGSTIKFEALDWDDDLPDHLASLSSTSKDCLPLDLVIAADCTYNSDSSPALVNTIHSLAKTSPKVVIAIAMKKRHSSEDVFFDLMSEAGFQTANTIAFPLPGDETLGEETIYLHTYSYGTTEQHNKVTPKEHSSSR